MQRRPKFSHFFVFATLAVMLVSHHATADADEGLFGVTASPDMIDFSSFKPSDFSNALINAVNSRVSMTQGGPADGQIGAIWTGGAGVSGGSDSSGGCFISASVSEFGGLTLLFVICLVTALYGLRLVLRSANSKNDLK